MPTNFDRLIPRRGTNSIKWHHYPEDVLPLWVADMDICAPEPIIKALHAKVEHGVFGYEAPSPALTQAVAARMQTLYGWRVSPEMVVATPGVIAGFTAAAHTVCQPGQAVLVQPPVYPPFLTLGEKTGLIRQDAPLALSVEGRTLRYAVDFDAFEQAIDSGGTKTGMFLLCNPHNPTGVSYSHADLARMAEICLRNGITMVADEIHSELLPGGGVHIPLAALDPEIGARTITLIAPSKTYNVPGLFCAFAIIPDPDLLRRYKTTVEAMSLHVNSLGLAAAEVAYSGECDGWLRELNIYLKGNRDYLFATLRDEFDDIRVTLPEATYLAWLDCNDLVRSGRIPAGTPYEFFLKEARVALNEGREFGPGGEGFVRLNFGCPRLTLVEALDRMKAALGRAGQGAQ